jgi:hypothetical protein
MRRRRRLWLAPVLAAVLAAGIGLGVTSALGAPGPPGEVGTVISNAEKIAKNPGAQAGAQPIDPQWATNTVQRAIATTTVKNNTIRGAIANRNRAERQWKAAEAAWKAGKGPQPNPLAKPEYLVVWAAKQNAADLEGKEVGLLAENGTINPEGLSEMLDPQFLPGLDGFVVIDTRKYDIDGRRNPEYGTVVNFVQLPAPWGIETEAHHMQYEWLNGEPIIAGGLFNDAIFMLSVKDIPNMKLQNIDPPQEHPEGSVPDAFDAVGNGDMIGTLMGGPLSNFAGSPGAVVTFKPCAKGLCQVAEVPAGKVGGVLTGNGNGVPEPCTVAEAEPLGTCANPHGIQIRQDLHRMVTADYAEPREVITDPVKPVNANAFRPTVRVWNTSNPLHPKLIAVAHLASGPQVDANPGHDDPLGVMEDAKTWPDGKQYHHGLDSDAFFAESMCGGGIYMTPNVLTNKGNASGQWQEVWNDGISEERAPGGHSLDEPGGCSGGSWTQLSPSNTILFHSVIGRSPLSDNYFDHGEIKLVYDINVSPLIKAYNRTGHVLCNLSAGIHSHGYDLSGIQLFEKLSEGKRVADCPYLISDLVVHDPTTGGPHWGALDNQSVDQDGIPYRLSFSDYFVARSGVDGDHMLYIVDISPTGVLSYDSSLRDQETGSVGIDFNRRNWPGSPDAGFYKPHSMVWVCPPGICPIGAPTTPRKTTAADIKNWARQVRAHRRRT